MPIDRDYIDGELVDFTEETERFLNDMLDSAYGSDPLLMRTQRVANFTKAFADFVTKVDKMAAGGIGDPLVAEFLEDTETSARSMAMRAAPQQ